MPGEAPRGVRSRPGSEPTPLIPARVLDEFVYCPQLVILEWFPRHSCRGSIRSYGTLPSYAGSAIVRK